MGHEGIICTVRRDSFSSVFYILSAVKSSTKGCLVMICSYPQSLEKLSGASHTLRVPVE